MLDGQCRWRLLVELGDLVKDIDSFLFSTFGQEELGRLVKIEDNESQEEDEQCHTTENDDKVSPSHVRLCGATRFSCVVCWVLASQNVWVTSIFGDSTVCDTGCGDDSDRLPHGQERYKISSVLRQEFEGDQGVDGNIPSEPDTREEVKPADGLVVVSRSSLQVSLFLSSSLPELTMRVPKIDVIKQVRLNAHFLPMMSTAKPKPKAPMLMSQ